MPPVKASRGWLLGGIGLAVGLLVGYITGRDDSASVNPQLRALDADLWIQTSAEYHACCLQTYRLAAQRLKTKLAGLTKEGLPPAVVLDLDETVFDNSPFQTWLYRHRLAYSDALWERWERDCADEVRLVPGARDFIVGAERAGLTAVYISNRLEKHQASTVEALAHLGLDTRGIDGRLLLVTTTSDKTKRREDVEKRYRVLMYVGDNLRDFSEEFRAPKVDPTDLAGLKAAIAQRKRKVDRHLERWGDEWIILPNPCYGEWSKLEGRRPVDVLNQATMPGP